MVASGHRRRICAARGRGLFSIIVSKRLINNGTIQPVSQNKRITHLRMPTVTVSIPTQCIRIDRKRIFDHMAYLSLDAWSDRKAACKTSKNTSHHDRGDSPPDESHISPLKVFHGIKCLSAFESDFFEPSHNTHFALGSGLIARRGL
jgi:hypothetical protein